MNRDVFLYWWPVIARLLGALGGFGQMAAAVVTHQSADVAFLGFCGALVVAPAVFPTESRPKPSPTEEKSDVADRRS